MFSQFCLSNSYKYRLIPSVFLLFVSNKSNNYHHYISVTTYNCVLLLQESRRNNNMRTSVYAISTALPAHCMHFSRANDLMYFTVENNKIAIYLIIITLVVFVSFRSVKTVVHFSVNPWYLRS